MNLGLHSSNSYFTARDPSRARPLLVNSLWVSFGLGSAVALAVTLGLRTLNVYPDVAPRLFVIGALLVPFLVFFNLGTNLLVGLDRIRAFNVFQIASALATVAGFAAVALRHGDAFDIVAATVVAQLVVAIALTATLFRGLSGERSFAFQSRALRESFRYAFKAYVVCLLGYLILRANVLLLKRYASSESLGYYSVAAQASDLLGILPQSLSLVLFPTLVRSNVQDRWNEFRARLGGLALYFGLACLATGLLTPLAIRLAFGERFLPAVPLVWAILPGTYCLGLSTLPSQYLAASGFPRALIGVWCLVGVTLVGSALALMPPYGALGAAASFSIGHAVLLVLTFALARRHKRTEEAAR